MKIDVKTAAALFFSVTLLLVVLWHERGAQTLSKTSLPEKTSANQRRSAVEVQYISTKNWPSTDMEQNDSMSVSAISEAHADPAGTDQSVETVDTRKKYRISLKGLTKKKTSNAAGYYVLDGTVDGSKFSLKIPKHALDTVSGPLMLEVTNLSNGTVQSVPFTFSDHLTDISKKHIVDFYTRQPGDYAYHDEKIRLPGE